MTKWTVKPCIGAIGEAYYGVYTSDHIADVLFFVDADEAPDLMKALFVELSHEEQEKLVAWMIGVD